MTKARLGAASAVVDGKIYVIGGMAGQRKVEAYDPATDTWTEKAELGGPTVISSASVVNGKIYVIGGNPAWNGAPLARVWEYDPEIDAWMAKTDMPTARDSLVTSVVDGKIYAMGGAVWDAKTGTGEVLGTVEEYDPVTDTWTQKADMPGSRCWAAAGTVDGKIYVLGGMRGAPAPVSGSVYVYDPTTDTWTEAASMPGSRVWAALAVHDGRIYIFGGNDDYDDDPADGNVFAYDPAADAWTEKADMPFERWGMVSGLVEGKIYLIGGSESAWNFQPYSAEVWEYDPELAE
jgi:N-acetylneuraminic acid mutarotase